MSCWLCGAPIPHLSGETTCERCRNQWEDRGVALNAEAVITMLHLQVQQARAAAQEYYQDIRELEGDHQWEKHYAHDPEQPDRTWLKPVRKLGP